MININKENRNKASRNMQRLLDIIHNDPKYYPGSFHENTNIPEIIEAINKILYQDNNDSVYFIVDRNPNDSMDLTIDKIE